MAFVHTEEKVDNVYDRTPDCLTESFMDTIIKSMSNHKKCFHEYLKDVGVFRCSKCSSTYIKQLQPLKKTVSHKKM